MRLVTEHTLTHYEEYTWGSDAGVAWKCPHCAATGTTATRDQAASELRTHLGDQHWNRFTIEHTHISEEINSRGSLLIDAQSDRSGVDTIRAYVRSGATSAVIVTSQPSTQIEQLQTSSRDLPDAISLVTTQDVRSREGDPETLRLSVLYESSVGIDLIEAGSLLALGKSIGNAIDRHLTTHGSVCVDIGILAEMLERFDIEKVFKFITKLEGLATQKGAFVYYVLDVELERRRDFFLLQQPFECVVTARGEGLVQE